MGNDFKRRLHEFHSVEDKIRAGEQLVAEQRARVAVIRQEGFDTKRPINLLRQFELSLQLLIDTRAMICRELDGTKVHRARLRWRRSAGAT